MDEKDQYELAREMIRHEDGLVNNRVTWLLIFQGILFSAFMTGIQYKWKTNGYQIDSLEVNFLLCMIAIVGLYTSITAGLVIGEAYRQIYHTTKWWKEKDNCKNFPPIRGEPNLSVINRVFSTSRMPYVLAVIWVIFIVLLFIKI